jgi:dynein heavy chain 1
MKKFGDQKIVKTSFQEPNFQKILENAIRFGIPLLIEDVERVDPILLNVLGKELHKASGRVVLRLGSRDIDFSPTFKLFLLSRNPCISLPPEICSRLTLINFNVTRSSLKNEILDRTLESERPDISQKRQELLKLQGEYQLKLRLLEDKLLESLNSSKGNILNDESVITHLEKLQSDSSDLLNKSREAENTLEQIENAALHYSEFSHKCSEIFFLLERFSSLNRSYQFSLEWFLKILSDILQHTTQSVSVASSSRLNTLFEIVFKTYYERTSLSMLQPHRLVLMFGLFELKNNLNEIVDKKWIDFLLGLGISDLDLKRTILPEYIPAEKVDGFNSLLSLPGFENLQYDLEHNQSSWAAFLNENSTSVNDIEFCKSENGKPLMT